MTHPETHIVTADNGPRPAGRPDQCFYCKSSIGTEHMPDCVCRLRTVVVEAIITYTIDVPEQWSAHDIEYQRNDGSWCANGMLGELEKICSDDPENPRCLCEVAKFKYVREATADDEWKSNTPKDILKGNTDSRTPQERLLAEWNDFKAKWDIAKAKWDIETLR